MVDTQMFFILIQIKILERERSAQLTACFTDIIYIRRLYHLFRVVVSDDFLSSSREQFGRVGAISGPIYFKPVPEVESPEPGLCPAGVIYVIFSSQIIAVKAVKPAVQGSQLLSEKTQVPLK